jgi:6-phosphogluconolactonase
MRFIKKKTEKLLINEFISVFKNEILKKKKNKKKLNFVLTGGSSPKNLYKTLAKSNLDWKDVNFFWGDERFVPQNSKHSNYKLANDLLLKKIKIKKNNIFPIKTKEKTIYLSSKNYSKKLNKFFRKKIKFDVFLLGMGDDGHVASIFPGSNELNQKFICKPIFRKDFQRITIGLNVINKSKRIFLWLNNKSKTKIFKKLSKIGKKIPINKLNKSKTTIFLIN